MTDKQITPELRRKVAEAIVSHEQAGPMLHNSYYADTWFRKLTTALAKLIKAKKGLVLTSDGILFYVLLERFNEALADNNTSALESLFAELIGETDA